jgi:hypothetical protein
MPVPQTETLLTFITLVFLIGTPIYILLREKMVKTKKPLWSYKTTARVIKLTFIILLLMFMVSSFYIALFLSILLRAPELTFTHILFGIMFLFMICISFFGSGIYITSIILEDFTLPQLRHIKEFKTQFIATHLFHGPISHLMIYFSMLLGLLVLAVLDIFTPLQNSTTYSSLVLIIMGSFFGLFYSIWQIYNGTAPHHFVPLLLSLTVFLTVYTINSELGFEHLPMAAYFTGFCTSALMAITVYVLTVQTVKGKPINWDGSGY